MFKNLFKNKKEVNTTNTTSTIDFIAQKVNASILPMITHKLFMHYHNSSIAKNLNDPAWQNQGVFFWTAKESFEKKSLPPEFNSFEKRFFIFNKISDNFSLSCGKAMPWFGMPGNGDKYFISNNESQVPLEELFQSNIIQYVTIVELNESNVSVLMDRANYRIVLDDENMKYNPSTDKFFFNNNETTLGEAYKLGGIKIIKIN